VPRLPPLRVSQNRVASTQEEVRWSARLHWALPLRHAGVWPLILEVRRPHPTLPRQTRGSSYAGRHEKLQAVHLLLLINCFVI